MHLQALQAYLIKNLCTCFKLFLKFEQPGPPVGSLKGGAKLLLEVVQLHTDLSKISFFSKSCYSCLLCSELLVEDDRDIASELRAGEKSRSSGKQPMTVDRTGDIVIGGGEVRTSLFQNPL